MSDKIERVARCLHAQRNPSNDKHDPWQLYVPDACAVIDAMREPTDTPEIGEGTKQIQERGT